MLNTLLQETLKIKNTFYNTLEFRNILSKHICMKAYNNNASYFICFMVFLLLELFLGYLVFLHFDAIMVHKHVIVSNCLIYYSSIHHPQCAIKKWRGVCSYLNHAMFGDLQIKIITTNLINETCHFLEMC